MCMCVYGHLKYINALYRLTMRRFLAIWSLLAYLTGVEALCSIRRSIGRHNLPPIGIENTPRNASYAVISPTPHLSKKFLPTIHTFFTEYTHTLMVFIYTHCV